MPTLNWMGKDKVVNHHNDVPYRVLERKYSFDGTGQCREDNASENMIIHGDNLEALKALLPRYEGRVKCIYIDPPYNTGNEKWVYNDNVNDPRIKKWLGEVVGKEGEDFSRHDKWLCMMYPRLKLLQKLLADDGAIFISIDDNEMYNLKFICDEIFGCNNYIDRITVIVKTEGRRYGYLAKTHENILVYAKNISDTQLNDIEVEGKEFQYKDDDGGFNLKGLRNRNVRAFNSSNRPNLRYPFYINEKYVDSNGFYDVSVHDKSDGLKEIWPQTIDGLESVWRWGREKADKEKKSLCACKGKDGTIRVFQKERKLTETAKTVWFDKEFTSIFGTKEQKVIFNKPVFDFPKPQKLLARILEIATDKDSIVLDSFAGSGTTAHAVLNMNKADGGNRKFILIEMEDYADSITAERVKRVINGYGEEKKKVEGTGGDFSYYELGEPLFIEDELNPAVSVEKIRDYIYYMETKQPLDKTLDSEEPYFMAVNDTTAYYFFYEQNKETVLDYESLNLHVKQRAEHYVIYADSLLLTDEFLAKYNITFKKIPRDIVRL